MEEFYADKKVSADSRAKLEELTKIIDLVYNNSDPNLPAGSFKHPKYDNLLIIETIDLFNRVLITNVGSISIDDVLK